MHLSLRVRLLHVFLYHQTYSQHYAFGCTGSTKYNILYSSRTASIELEYSLCAQYKYALNT